MAHLEELPDITDPRFQPVWLTAVNRTAKKLGRTPSSDEIVDAYAELLPKFMEPDGSVNTAKKAFTLPELPYAYPDMPGLILREMNAEDIELIIPRMAYKDAETSRSAIMTRVNDPFTQMLAWEFNRRLVQTESLRLKPNGDVEIGTSVHCMHRTAEFWREIEKPVFERLLSLGVKEMSTLTLNSLLKYWKPIIVDFYKGKPGRVSDLTTQFTYPINASVFKGMPERRTAGSDWSYTHENMTFREMTLQELPTVLREVRAMHKDGLNIANQLEEKYVLDRAAVLLGYADQKLEVVRAIRPRNAKPNHGNMSFYHRVRNNREQRIGSYAATLWFNALGYKYYTIFADEAQLKHSSIKNSRESHPDTTVTAEFVDRGKKTYALETDIDSVLRRSIDEWLKPFQASE